MASEILDPNKLGELAWKLLCQAVQEKRMNVPNGSIVAVEDDDYLKLLQWCATAKLRGRRSVVRKPEDFTPKETKR